MIFGSPFRTLHWWSRRVGRTPFPTPWALSYPSVRGVSMTLTKVFPMVLAHQNS